MKRLTITKGGIVTHDNVFSSREDAEKWADEVADTGVFGKNAYDETVEATIDQDGNILAEEYTIHHPADYTVEISDYVKPIADISARQIRFALLSLGVTDEAIESAIATLPSPQKEQAMISWKHSTTFQRSEPAVAAIGMLLNLTSEQLDALWILGGSL